MKRVAWFAMMVALIGIVSSSRARRDVEKPMPAMAASQDIRAKPKQGKTVAILLSANDALAMRTIDDGIDKEGQRRDRE
jgi:hypothetical protein